MGFDIWYENPALQAKFQYGHNAIFNEMEARISLLYNLVERRIMPWQWDWENYTGDNADMIGFFYPEDFEAYLQIAHFESLKK